MGTSGNLCKCLHKEMDQTEKVWYKAPSFLADLGDFILDPLSESG